jgi:hypothetical protein
MTWPNVCRAAARARRGLRTGTRYPRSFLPPGLWQPQRECTAMPDSVARCVHRSAVQLREALDQRQADPELRRDADPGALDAEHQTSKCRSKAYPTENSGRIRKAESTCQSDRPGPGEWANGGVAVRNTRAAGPRCAGALGAAFCLIHRSGRPLARSRRTNVPRADGTPIPDTHELNN